MSKPWKVTEHAVTRLRPATIRKLRSLSLRGEGLMCGALADRRPTTRVFIVRRGDTVLGWAVAGVLAAGARCGSYGTHYYVRKRSRRQGVGRALLCAVERYLRASRVRGYYYRSNSNWGFFAHVDRRALRDYHA